MIRIAAVFFAVIILIGSGNALACSCAVDAFGPAASQNNIERAKFIVQGRVSFVAPEDEEKSEEFKNLSAFGITVSKTLKGEDTKILTAYAMTKSTCGVSIESLQRLDFFVLYERKGNLMLAGACENYIAPEDQRALIFGNYKP